MIISIRGPSGSGKSTLVRAITNHYDYSCGYRVVGRKKPLFMQYIRTNDKAELIVPGHYEIKNGGIDTLPSLEAAYGIARDHDKVGRNVLMEGKCMSDGVRHAHELQLQHRDVRIVHVNTDVSTCLASVQQRGHNIALRSIQRTHAKVMKNMQTFREMRVPTFSGNRAECEAKIVEWLGLET